MDSPVSLLSQCGRNPAFLDALVERETSLKLDLPLSDEERVLDAAHSVATGTADLLEFVHLVLVACEVFRAHPELSHADLFERVQLLTKLDVQQVVSTNEEMIRRASKTAGNAGRNEVNDLKELVSLAESITREYPEASIGLSRSLGLLEIAVRIDRAFSAIKSFIVRNDRWMDRRVRLVGERYAAGGLTLQAVGAALGMKPSDAVALLESFGFSRPPERIELREADRNALYAELREDRVRRAGKPDPSPTAIVRDVIASQRIENIDARPWFEDKLK